MHLKSKSSISTEISFFNVKKKKELKFGQILLSRVCIDPC